MLSAKGHQLRLQLFREHLASELLNLPRTSSQDVQSHAVVTAALLRYIVERLKIEGITVPDGDGGRPHTLKPLLGTFIHYERFNLDRRSRDGDDRMLVSLKSPKGREYRISLDDYFAVAGRFAHDDAFMASALVKRLVTTLHKLEKDRESADEDFFDTLGSLMMDAMELLHKLDAESRIRIPDIEMDGWMAETIPVEGRWGSRNSATTQRFKDLVTGYNTVFPNTIYSARREGDFGLVYMSRFSRRPRDELFFALEWWLGALEKVQAVLPEGDW